MSSINVTPYRRRENVNTESIAIWKDFQLKMNATNNQKEIVAVLLDLYRWAASDLYAKNRIRYTRPTIAFKNVMFVRCFGTGPQQTEMEQLYSEIFEKEFEKIE